MSEKPTPEKETPEKPMLEKDAFEQQAIEIPYAMEMESSVRKKLGRNFDLKEVFTDEKLRESQVLIDTAHADFLKDVKTDFEALEKHYASAVSQPAQAKNHMALISQKAFVMKARLESLGLQLNSDVARLLSDYTKPQRTITDKTLLVVRKHLDVLGNAIREETKGDGGALGRELLENLTKLGQKYA